MSMFWILLMFIAVEISAIFMFLLVVKAIDRLIKRIDRISALYSDSFEKLVEAYDGLRKIDDARQEVYRKIVDSNKQMDDALNQGFEIDRKIVDTWKGIQETYSFAYEEYRHCIDKLEGLDKASVDIYAKLLVLEEYTKPIEISTELSEDDIDWDPFDDDDFWEEEDEQESDET